MSATELVGALGEEQSMVRHNVRPLVRCATDFCGNGTNCYLQQDEAT